MKAKVSSKHKISPYFLVLLSFLVIIGIGSFLLTLPISRTNGEWGDYFDSLYMATSATCVTGADLFPNGGMVSRFNFFGQLLVLIMIQIGGLGFLVVIFFFVSFFKKKLTYKDRAFLSQAVSSDSIANVVKFIRKLILVTCSLELLATLVGLPAYIVIFPNEPGKAIWYSIFHAISAFNNAGFDIFGDSSLILNYGTSVLDSAPVWCTYYIMGYTTIFIILGGISYLVLFEVLSFKKRPSQWSAFTKICILMAGILIVAGTLLLFLTDGLKGPGSLSIYDAFYLSVSSRTCGFTSYDVYELSTGGKLLVCLLMFIGGSPLGTASGIKTTTIFLIFLSIICYFRGKKVTAFNRFYSQNLIVKTMAVFISSIIIIIVGYFAITMFEIDNPVATTSHVLFETFSCFSTTGYTTLLTVSLTIGSKITCAVLMFLGRLGPMTLLQIFSSKQDVEEKTHFRYIEEDILIG